MSSLISIHLCWICSKAVDFYECKIDEHGSAVHEACYAAVIALQNSSLKAPPSCRSVAHFSGAPITRYGP